MSKGIRFLDEFKQDAVAQVVERGYLTRDAASQDMFDYIEMFYNPTRDLFESRHASTLRVAHSITATK